MYEAVPGWRLLLTPPHWFRLLLVVGPLGTIRIHRDGGHPVHRRGDIHNCAEARRAYANWRKTLTPAQLNRYFWGLPRAKWRQSARVIRPLKFHPELARIRREQDEIREWSRRTGRDSIESPAFQKRLRRVRERLAGPSGDEQAPPANDS